MLASRSGCGSAPHHTHRAPDGSRWALGDDKTLQLTKDPTNGNTLRYLPAGAQAVVWGAVRMTDLEAYNPQDCWAGLIHEQVSIDPVNNNVGARSVELTMSV